MAHGRPDCHGTCNRGLNQEPQTDYRNGTDADGELRFGDRSPPDGNPIINNWTDHGPSWDYGQLDLIAGQFYPVTLEYYERGGGAVMELYWEHSSHPRAIIPSSHLFGDLSDDGDRNDDSDQGDDDDQGDGGETFCATTDEGNDAVLAACPVGTAIDEIVFASYGTPAGACERESTYTTSSCHSDRSRAVVEDSCLNRESCTVSARNGLCGDPCPGTYNRLYVQYICR